MLIKAINDEVRLRKKIHPMVVWAGATSGAEAAGVRFELPAARDRVLCGHRPMAALQ